MRINKLFSTIFVTVIVLSVTLLGFSSTARNKGNDEYQVSPEIKEVYSKLSSQASVQSALTFIKNDHENTIEDQIEITEIPAPPFKEQKRAEYYLNRLKELGLQDVKMDQEGNVYGIRKGTGDGPTLFVSAHLDSVFPEGTDTTVKKKDGKLYAPGIADDARGLAALLSVVRALNESGIQTKGDIIFGGTVGEEGLGDLRGVKAFFKEHPEVDGYISMDGSGHTGITYLATGSHRYEITYIGPGGHSFGNFGTPSAIHAMGRAIGKIADVKTPENPKTTFNVGTVEGGTSVNAIAAKATMLLDMRSNAEPELLDLEEKILRIAREAVEEENKRWKSDQMQVQIKQVGDRPAASQPADATIVQAAWASVESIGHQPSLSGPSSTDANYSMSLGIPSLTLGSGGKSGSTHSLEEWFDPTDAYLGPQRQLMTILGLVGVENVSDPLLEQKN